MSNAELLVEVAIQWFTVDEAARYLRVSRRTIYKWTKDGRLPTYLIGDRRHRRYRRHDLDKVPRPAEKQHITKMSPK